MYFNSNWKASMPNIINSYIFYILMICIIFGILAIIIFIVLKQFNISPDKQNSYPPSGRVL